MKKKALSLILSAAMALSLTVVPASAVSVSNFSDVSSDNWYYDSVRYVAERDYMNGTSATTFEPNSDMTRAMFATLISRVAGAEVDNSAASEFTDVVSGQWYTGAIEWGVENELITGYGNGLFGTNDSITRQDIAVLTQRFLDWYCAENNKSLNFEPLVENFTDADSIADYAQEAVEFCREAGLLTGYEDGSFRPLGTATRAEIAAIVERIEFIMESASPAVVYTDTEGNRATLEIAVGDVITVDPNNGSVTYDGTTHRDEFTITATEEGITLPDATRSGYRFDGWKVETDANGAYTFTAQWTRTSSGGGGGGGVTRYTYTLDWNYDGAPDSESVTVTRGTEIELPTTLPDDAERSGYTLVSWTTEENGTGDRYAAGNSYTVNANVILYAQWAEAESTAVNYTVSLDLTAKGKNLNINANAVDGNNVFEGTNVYHVVFNPSGTVNTAASDHIDLVSIAKDMCDSEAIQTVLDNLSGFTYTQDGQEKQFVNDEGEVQEILVRKVAISDVLGDNTETINRIVEQISLPEVDAGFVTDILEDLDNGRLASVESGSNEEATLSVIQEELRTQIGSGTLYETVQTIVDPDLLTNLGLDETAINELAQEYLVKINNILGIDTDTIGLNALSVSTREGSDTSTAGGIEVRINPVTVLSEQYGTAESDYSGVWEQIERVLGKDKTQELKAYDSVNDLIAACNPVKFFNENETDGVYTLKTAAEYTEQLKELINLAEAARQEVIIDAGRDEEWVKAILEDIRTNLEEYSFADKLTDARIKKLAELLAKKTPLLTDLVTNPDEAGTRTASVEMTAGGKEDTSADLNLDDLIERILNRIGVSDADFDDTTKDLIDQIVEKLSGTYSATVTIDVTECNN